MAAMLGTGGHCSQAARALDQLAVAQWMPTGEALTMPNLETYFPLAAASDERIEAPEGGSYSKNFPVVVAAEGRAQDTATLKDHKGESAAWPLLWLCACTPTWLILSRPPVAAMPCSAPHVAVPEHCAAGRRGRVLGCADRSRNGGYFAAHDSPRRGQAPGDVGPRGGGSLNAK